MGERTVENSRALFFVVCLYCIRPAPPLRLPLAGGFVHVRKLMGMYQVDGPLDAQLQRWVMEVLTRNMKLM